MAKALLMLDHLSAAVAVSLLICSGTCSAISSVLLREARGSGTMLASEWTRYASYGFAIASYGVGFALYAIALRRLPLTLAYPVMIATTMLEVYVYGLVAGEAFRPAAAVGAALILLGAALVVR